MAYRVLVHPAARDALRGLGGDISRPIGFALRGLEQEFPQAADEGQ